MCTIEEQELLKHIANLSDKWFRDTVGTEPTWPCPSRNPVRRKRRSPNDSVDVFRRKLADVVVADVAKVFHLERCALLLPVEHKQALWRIASQLGYPPVILQRHIYRPGLGLTGKTLQGQQILTANILADERRSRHHSDQWYSQSDEAEVAPIPRAFLGVPLWWQPADLTRETLGALVSIRPQPFSGYETAAMDIVGEMVSQAFQGLAAYQQRVESDTRIAGLYRLWDQRLGISDKLRGSLRLFQQLVPFKRLLLSLVDASGTLIEGHAVVGFRPSLIADTRRQLYSNPPDCPHEEDVLALFVRENRAFPQIILKDDPHVHTITALRHQVQNDLLLIPLIGREGTYIGVVLAELPDVRRTSTAPFRLSAAELERCDVLAQQLAALISRRRICAVTSASDPLWPAVLRGLGQYSDEMTTPALNSLLSRLCDLLCIQRAVIYSYDKAASVLRVQSAYDRIGARDIAPSVVLDPSTTKPSILQKATTGYGPVFGQPSDVFPPIGHRFHSSATATSAVAIPICLGAEAIGILGIEANGIGPPLDGLLLRLQPFLGLVGQMLRSWALEQTVAALTRRADAHHSLAHLLASLTLPTPSTPESLHGVISRNQFHFKTIIHNVADVLGAHLCELFVPEHPVRLDGEGQIPPAHFQTAFMRMVFFWDEAGPENADPHRAVCKAAAKGGLTASVLQTMRRQTSDNVPDDEVWSRERHDFNTTQSRSWLGIPIVYDVDGEEKCWGVLSATRRRESKADLLAFDEDDVIAAQSLANWLGGCLVHQYHLRGLQERTAECLSRFDHDLPNLINHIENISGRYTKSRSPSRKNKLAIALGDSVSALKSSLLSLIYVYSNPDRVCMAQSGINIARIAAQLEQAVSADSSSRDADFTVEPKALRGCECLADEEGLVYALYLLVNNAFRSCQEKSASSRNQNYSKVVSVRFEQVDSSLRVTVQDNGNGFSPNMGDLNRIEEGVSHWRKKSSGIGRALVRRLVASMGGSRLTFRNISDETGVRGALVQFQLPCRKG